jgi:hypothetical protein
MRRKNGVSPYHMYLGQILKRAKLKGKGEEAKASRKAAFKKAVARAKEMAKSGFPASASKKVEARNEKIRAEKKARAEKRAGKVTVRTARRRAGSAAAYKALSAVERRALRTAPTKRKARASAASSKKSGSKRTGVVSGKGNRKMHYIDGKLVSKAAYEAHVAAKPASRSRRASAAASKPASSKKTGVVTGKGNRKMHYIDGKLVSKAAYEAHVAAKPSRRSRPASASTKANPRRKRKGMRRRARKNPSFGGALAVVKEFGREAFTVQGIGGAALVGVAHGFVAPMVADYLANMFPQSYRVPVLDVEVSASSFAFTATGAVAGAALGLVGYLTGRPALGLGLGGLAFTSGLVIDTVGLVQSRGEAGSMGDVAYGAIDNEGVVYGDVAYGAIDNNGMVYGDVAYGDVAYGDVAYGGVMGEAGMSYGAACMSEYADAESADAADSGADFSEEEGQALMEGPLSWLRRFGRAPRRMTGIRGAKSRHAGRAGHRWGWLIKLVGMDKAAKIAALPPEKRLKVIAALRQQAVSSLSTLMAQHAATTTEATVAAAHERVPAHLLLPPPPARPNLLPAPQAMGLDLMALGAGGAMGSGGYGTVMYAGGGF